MAWTKSKTAILIGAGILLAVAPLTVIVKAIEHRRAEDRAWDTITTAIKTRKWRTVEAMTNTVVMRPTKFRRFNDAFGAEGDDLMLGLAVPAAGVFGHAYGISRTRIANPPMLPSGKYDFFVYVSGHAAASLQAEIKRQFGLVATKEVRQTNVLVLTVANANPPGLKLAGSAAAGGDKGQDSGAVKLKHTTIPTICMGLEHQLKIPIVDETGLTNHYDIVFQWDEYARDPAILKKAVLDQLGLQLTPSREFVEMLILEKAR